MTTTNNNESRVTLKSALEAGDVKGLGNILAKLGGDKDGVAKLGLTFSLAITAAKDVLKDQAKEAAQRAEEIAKRREDKKAARLAKLAENEAAIKEEKENMIKFLMDTVNGLGLDLEAAEVAAQAAIEKKHGAGEKSKKYTFKRVAVIVDGKEYMMPTSGNMVQVLKDAMNAGGYTSHKDFILDHAKDADEAEAAFAE